MRRKHALVTLAVAALVIALAPALQPAEAAGGPNLSLGKTASASSSNSPYTANNLNDGNQGTYWESTNNAFPQWAQIDLGSSTSIDQVVLKLPTGWGARTETLSLQGSTDGSSFSTILASAGYPFDPASGNTVTINFTATNTRYVRANITANTGWPAAQLAEFEVHGTSTSTGNLASGKTMTSSTATAPYTAGNANDGNPASYWESANNAFPQWLQVDLGRRRRGQQGGAQAAAVDRLGRAHPDARRAGQLDRLRLHRPRRLGRLRVQPGQRQHGHRSPSTRPRPATCG